MVEFSIFGCLLLFIAFFHKHAMKGAIVGLLLILAYKLLYIESFSFSSHISHEWHLLLNLLGLLLGFSILAKIVEESGVPELCTKFLPQGFWGNFSLLSLIFILSSFLDNIAAAMIGGALAASIFRSKVHIGYLVAIIAASNAGGAGSVLGDTTTTMMWISGISPVILFKAYIASFGAFFVFAPIASWQQARYQKEKPIALASSLVDYKKVTIVIAILAFTILSNYLVGFPALGLWVAIILGALLTKIPWKELQGAAQGTVFLLCLVMAASLMPVERLPAASTLSTLGLGFISAFFDNIPLTKLALNQGGYDWALLAYAVGFGGSMLWFGSSAGVALSGKFPELRSTFNYLKHGGHVIIGYLFGFYLLSLLS